MNENDILTNLKNAVVQMDDVGANAAAREALEVGLNAYTAINSGLVAGMVEVGELYEQGEYYIPEVLMACDALNAGLEVLKPHLEVVDTKNPVKIVIGVVQGDTHDIGKNLVKILQETAGFEIHDLGRDVNLPLFVEKAIEVQADVIALSTLMTTTMGGMRTVVDMMREKGIREKVKVIIGGGPISQTYANDIAADGYASDANSAVRLVKNLMLN